MKQNSRCACGESRLGVSQCSSCGGQARNSCGSCGGQARNSCTSCEAFRARPWNEGCACRSRSENRCGSSAFRARPWNEGCSCRCGSGSPAVAKNLCRNGCGERAAACPLQQNDKQGGEGCDTARSGNVDCDCDPAEAKRSLAMVYGEKQCFSSLYDPKEGLCRGTVFQELNQPFLAYGRK